MNEPLLDLDALLGILSLHCEIENIPLEDVLNEIHSKIPHMVWRFEYWDNILTRTKPPLTNVIKLLERKDFREEKFGDETFTYLGVKLDSPKLVDEYIISINEGVFLTRVILWGSLEVLKYFVSLGYDPRVDNDGALKQASVNGHLKVVKYLIEECGCNPRVENNYPIRWAIMNSHLEVVKYLAEECGCDRHGILKMLDILP